VRREIGETHDLSIKRQLERLGFQVQMESVPYLGLLFRETIGQAIADVLDDSPAGGSGIAPGDVIVSINGFPFTAAGLKWAVKQGSVRLEVTRGHRTLSFEIAPGARKQIASMIWNGSEEQAERIRRWLKRPEFKPRAGETISLAFYENFHGVEIVV